MAASVTPDYGGYLRQVANGRAPRPTDPYAAILASLPKPLTGAQITHQAQNEIDPLVAAVTKQIGGQTAAATHAIGGFTADAANKLAGIDFAAPYTQGEQGQAAVDAALRDSLAGAGQQGADQLAQRLGVINDPSVGAAAHALAANGAANGTTQVAQGSASLGNLIANAASASEYGQKQPGITRLAGLQQIAAAGQQGQAAIAAKAAELEAQLPQIISNLQSRNDSRSSALASARQNQIARNDAISAGAATAQNAAVKFAAEQHYKYDALASENARAANAAQISAAKSDRSYRLQYSRTYGYDPVTGRTLPGYKRNAAGDVVKVSAAHVPHTPQLTAEQHQHYSGVATTIAEQASGGFSDSTKTPYYTSTTHGDPNGWSEPLAGGGYMNHHPALTAEGALNEMRKEGIPDAIALAAVKRYYGDTDPATNPAAAGPPAPHR